MNYKEHSALREVIFVELWKIQEFISVQGVPSQKTFTIDINQIFPLTII